ncbi:MAG: hypothetical protein JWN81_1536, partial [Solirubrobacterales bacterium]|nr:hypothetical protein [Solirubrobacterales bacterium]
MASRARPTARFCQSLLAWTVALSSAFWLFAASPTAATAGRDHGRTTPVTPAPSNSSASPPKDRHGERTAPGRPPAATGSEGAAHAQGEAGSGSGSGSGSGRAPAPVASRQRHAEEGVTSGRAKRRGRGRPRTEGQGEGAPAEGPAESEAPAGAEAQAGPAASSRPRERLKGKHHKGKEPKRPVRVSDPPHEEKAPATALAASVSSAPVVSAPVAPPAKAPAVTTP